MTPFTDIYAFLYACFSAPGAKLFLELGAHVGSDTAKLAALPGVTLHIFEPYAPNLAQIPAYPNVVRNAMAVAAVDGVAPFHVSGSTDGVPFTYGSSLYAPAPHLATAYSEIVFDETVTVPTITLDTYVHQHRLERIDFIWADTQGAERDLILGGRRALARTRYLYTEYAEPPLYVGQPSRAEILALLPGWRVVADWPSGEAYDDILLENTGYAP